MPVVVRAPVELDVATAPAFRDELAVLLTAGGASIVIDMAGTEFIDSSGMGALVAVARLARARDGALCLRSVRPAVIKALRMASLIELLDASADPPGSG